MGNMISVVCGVNNKSHQKLYSDSTTIRDIFDDWDIDYTRGKTMLNGNIITNLDKSLAEYGVVDKASVFSIAKADNAVV